MGQLILQSPGIPRGALELGPSCWEMGTGSCADLVRNWEKVNFKYNSSLTCRGIGELLLQAEVAKPCSDRCRQYVKGKKLITQRITLTFFFYLKHHCKLQHFPSAGSSVNIIFPLPDICLPPVRDFQLLRLACLHVTYVLEFQLHSLDSQCRQLPFKAVVVRWCFWQRIVCFLLSGRYSKTNKKTPNFFLFNRMNLVRISLLILQAFYALITYRIRLKYGTVLMQTHLLPSLQQFYVHPEGTG